ncbi:MAG TPA: hypothetical protein VF337_07775 [Candidatus Limnocylindrales bacterium]
MKAVKTLPRVPEISPELARIPTRRILVFSPVIRYQLGPGDRALVAPGDHIVPGMPILERTPDAELIEVGRMENWETRKPENSDKPEKGPGTVADERLSPLWKEERLEAAVARQAQAARLAGREPMAVRTPAGPRVERRRPPVPGKWWIGGGDRRGKPERGRPQPRVGGTLLFESEGRWRAAAGERHEVVQSPVAGVILSARNAVDVTIEVVGAAMPGAIAAGEPSRGYLDVPRLTDGELWASALDVGRAGAVVVAGSRISGQAISRARAMSIRGLIAGSVGEGELRDLEASSIRQKASLAPSVPFALIALDGHGRRPIATPILAMLAALAGREVAIVTDPALLVFDAAEVPLPEMPPDWIRARSGSHAGQEGRWLSSVGMYRFRGGLYLEGAVVRFVDDEETSIVPVADLERFVF